jgi:hypothetical protein
MIFIYKIRNLLALGFEGIDRKDMNVGLYSWMMPLLVDNTSTNKLTHEAARTGNL